MRTVSLIKAQQGLSELVERASKGEQIGITLRGKIAAMIAPVPPAICLAQAFADIEKIRKRAKPLNGMTIKDLIEEGRR
jgi:antitoxin (DNA-binding transcriptional repressor) of toxin-antitoxin stability system